MGADEPAAGLSVAWRWVKIGLAFGLLGWAASCSHDEGAIDRPPRLGHFWSEDCQIHRACKPVKKPLRRCSPEVAASAARGAFRASRDEHDVRSIEGTLRMGRAAGDDSLPGICTLVGCEDPRWWRQACCNTCTGWGAILVGDDGSIVGLTGTACVGDESRRCCNIDIQGQKIIATGVLIEEPMQGQFEFLGPYDVCVL